LAPFYFFPLSEIENEDEIEMISYHPKYLFQGENSGENSKALSTIKSET
jgi:hypothetical protein